jgi:aryl-alcohol dehydrogenase-like predicted oxidoreductase
MEHVDVYYLHAPDRKTPAGETLSAIAELIGTGKTRTWGVSNFASWRALELSTLAEHTGAPTPIVSQVLYNALVRQIEIEHLDYCREHRLHVTVYNALAGGLLSGKHAGVDSATKGSRFDDNRFYQRRYWTARLFEHVAGLREIANDAELSLVALSYGWLAARPIDSVLVGPATLGHLDDALDGLEKPLDRAVVKRVDDLYRDFVGTDASYAR